jgi:ATP-binding cassette subfamily B protein
MTASKPSSDLRLYGRLLREARLYWPHIAGILALYLLTVPLTLLAPVPLLIVVDSAIGSHPLPGVFRRLPIDVTASSTAVVLLAVGLLLALALFGSLRGYANSLLETYTGEKLVLAFRARLFERMQRLSFAYHDKVGVSDSLYRIQYDAPAIQWVAVQGLIPFLTAGITLAGMVYVIARIDGELAVVALAISPVLFLVTGFYRRRLRSEWSHLKAVESSAMSAVHETLAALRVVKAFGQERREEQRFVRRSEQSLRSQLRLAHSHGGFDALIGLTIAAGTAAALFIGVRHVESGVLTLGSLLMVMGYLSQLYTPLQMINQKLVDLQESLESAERAFAMLDAAPDVAERPDAQPLSRAQGRVAFRDVCFAYPEGPRVLHQISFEVAPGTRVAVVGPTGAGKTTLTSLLMRFYDPTGGQIVLDGRDIRDYKLADLRHQFAIVLQEPVLFSTSIAENIAYARPDAGEAEVVGAARLAHAHDFIMRLPDRYQTVVGERGMTLSGGERQRIALARAFLTDAPILVLDEPTSSVDPATEAVILEATEQLMRGRTTFMIAHRSSTLKDCAVQFRIDQGRLVSQRTDRALASTEPR